MKLITAIIVVFVLVAGILGPQLLFVVDETQLAIVTRFGEPRGSSITKPGLNVKTPFVDKVTFFEKRLLLFDAPPESLLTKDKKRLVIDVYARGRISDPLLFFRTVRTEPQAASRAVDIISSELRREIALDDQSEIIRTSREAIMNRVRDSVAPKLFEFGIEVVDLRIKRADFPAEIADSIYLRMQAERQRIANRERAEGSEVDKEVRAEVDKLATIIRALAERDANITRGCGEAEAVKIFAEALQQDPEFYTFQRSLEANRTVLTQNTTVALPVDGFGQIFEDIRLSVIEATIAPAVADGIAGDTSAGGVVDLQSRCAEVAALRFLAGEIDAAMTELTLTDIESVEWADGRLGCTEEGEEDAAVGQLVVPGFRLTFRYAGQDHAVHTNQQGSQVVTCKSQP